MAISIYQVQETIGFPPESRRDKPGYYLAWGDLEEENGDLDMAVVFRQRAEDYLTYPDGVRIAALLPSGEVRYWGMGGCGWVASPSMAARFQDHWRLLLESLQQREPEWFIVAE